MREPALGCWFRTVWFKASVQLRIVRRILGGALPPKFDYFWKPEVIVAKKVLILEDDADQRVEYDSLFKQHGYEPSIPCALSLEELSRQAVALGEADKFFALVLDLNMGLLKGTEKEWGGLWLYLKLRRCGLLGRFKHIFVASRHGLENPRAIRPGSEYYHIKVFIEMAEIPYENVFCILRDAGFRRLIERVNALASADE